MLDLCISGDRAPVGWLKTIQQLHEQVSQLAGTVEQMARLKREDLFDQVERQRAFRIARSRYFPDDYFNDPAWDILLDLMKADFDDAGLPATHIGLDVAIPLSTVLRYVKRMERDGYVTRATDIEDNRRSIIRLTDKGRENLRRVIDSATVGADGAGPAAAAEAGGEHPELRLASLPKQS